MKNYSISQLEYDRFDFVIEHLKDWIKSGYDEHGVMRIACNLGSEEKPFKPSFFFPNTILL